MSTFTSGQKCLVEIRELLHQNGIIAAIENGEIEPWLHKDQETNWVRGRTILTYLTANDKLASCVDLTELKAIQVKGPDFYRKHFAGKVIVGWRGVRGVRVPVLCEDDGEVVLLWGHVDNDFDSDSPAPCRK